MSIIFGLLDGLKEGMIDYINFILSSLSAYNFLLGDALENNAQEYSGVAFSLVMTIAESVILPIAGVIFTYVVVNELIQIQLAHNNMHENVVIDVYKWMFKTFLGIMLISNAFTITNAFIEVGAEVISQVIPITQTQGGGAMIAESTELLDLNHFELFNIIVSLLVTNMVTAIGMILVHLFIIARFFEIYLYLMISPIPFATLTSQQLSQTGLNYIKNIISLAIQGLIILVSFSIYIAISASITMTSITDISMGNNFATGSVQGIILVLVLAVMVWRSRSIAQSLVGSH